MLLFVLLAAVDAYAASDATSMRQEVCRAFMPCAATATICMRFTPPFDGY